MKFICITIIIINTDINGRCCLRFYMSWLKTYRHFFPTIQLILHILERLILNRIICLDKYSSLTRIFSMFLYYPPKIRGILLLNRFFFHFFLLWRTKEINYIEECILIHIHHSHQNSRNHQHRDHNDNSTLTTK